MVQPVTPDPGDGEEPRHETNPVNVVVAVIAGLTAVLLAFVLASWVANRGDDSDKAASEPDQEVPTITVPRDPTGRLTDPAFRIQPQRARVADGGPLELTAFGDGCAGGSGELSVVQIGEATSNNTPGRLVLRRRFDVAANGTWEARPLLIGQAEGSYRVSAACERWPRANGLVTSGERRDVFVASEILELTGPATQIVFDVAPRRAEPNTATVVRLEGTTWCPNGRVEGTTYANGDRTVRKPFGPVPVDATGGWESAVVFSAAEATGTYSVEASCSEGFAFATETIQFVSDRRLDLGFLDRLLDRADEARPATPVRGVPTFTG